MRVGNEELLSIGRFAQVTGLTAKALRHYDDLGLLRPAYVDEASGYRWYALEQARDAVAIRRLRGFELSLDEIGAVLQGDDDTLRERLVVQRARLEGRAVETARLLDELDRVIQGEEKLVPERLVDYRIEDTPELTIVALEARATLEDAQPLIPELIQMTGAWARAHDGVPGAPLMVCPMDAAGFLEMQIGWPVAGTIEPAEPMKLVTLEAGRAVVHSYVGEFIGLHEAWRLFWQTLRVDGIEPRGVPREHYETSPEEVNDPSEHVTRLVWPLEAKEE
ncbi:MAG TPA: MerR family transcriptional regulator [Gaiellaceae bacterium]|nr:MerR family transcriptional regulator [Gaiellaceae bacterium]